MVAGSASRRSQRRWDLRAEERWWDPVLLALPLLCSSETNRFKPKTEPMKPKLKLSVSCFLPNRSGASFWKPKLLETEETEPMCWLKPIAQAELFPHIYVVDVF